VFSGVVRAIERGRAMALRDKWVHIKVSGEERDAWQAAAEAEGVTLADLVRARMVTKTVDREPRRRRAARRADPALLAAIGRVGNNLNQIGRWVNTYKKGAEVIPVIAALVSLERAVRDALTLHQGNPLSIAQNALEATVEPAGTGVVEGEGNPGGQADLFSLLPLDGQADEEGGETC